MSRLAARGLRKAYGGARALDGVDFDLEAGEIHALVGENGAGKSTLVKIIAGAVAPDAGDVSLDGVPHATRDPREARRRGISVVYQEFTLVPELTVAENVCLGREPGGLLLRRGDMRRAVQAVLDDLGVPIDAAAPVRALSVAHQQMVEIARAIAIDATVLILDEPTAALSRRETERLFDVLRRLRGRGLGLVYISHRLDEIFALADRITVLRDGRHVATAAARDVDRPQLIRWMVGRDVSEEFPPRTATPGAHAIEAAGLSHRPRFHDVSFAAAEGEIVGLAGLVGAGRTSAALAVAGALPYDGDVRIGGRTARFRSPAEAIAGGVVYVTEDRKGRGLFPLMETAHNITLTSLLAFTRAGAIDARAERAAASAAAARFGLRAASIRQRADTLSGGNQQKTLLARFLMQSRRVLILDEPTRGVDVGARADIYRLMNDLTAEGAAILMISSELPEVLGMADRVVVMREGRTTGELARAAATPERVMALA